MLPYIAWFAILAGPRCPSNVTARELLAEHLEWARRLRGVFMGHSQGGDRRSPEELGRAVDELERLLDAVVRRAHALHGNPQ